MPCVSHICSLPAFAGALQPSIDLHSLPHNDTKQRQQFCSSNSFEAPLRVLADTPLVAYGTQDELIQYQAFVYRCIEKAQTLVQADTTWECKDVLLVPMERALELVKAGKTSSGRTLAVGLIGYAQLAAKLSEQLKQCANANLSGKADRSAEEPCSSSTSSSSSSTSSSGQYSQFKVPALPLKRQRSPTSAELLQQQPQPAAEPQPDAQQQRRHSAPKRRATPQVWSGGPICMTPSAPPNSAMHGETVCDEGLLASWCPISGKRLKTDPQPGSPPAVDSKDSCADLQQQQQQQQPQQPMQQQQAVPMDSVQSWAAEQQRAQQQQQQQGEAVDAAGPRASSTSTRSNSHMEQGSAQAVPAAVPLSRAAVSGSRSDAVAALKHNMHEDPTSKPAADVLLFNKATQLPVVNWTGPIKHKANGRVVEMCSLSLQVPEAFLEEFPAALYAAEIRHRKSVSLGRHVVCRANLQVLSEHQLASLAMMARGQLVGLCMLQTAELHVVPYFDNKNHVRCVGFLKIKAV